MESFEKNVRGHLKLEYTEFPCLFYEIQLLLEVNYIATVLRCSIA